MAQKPLNGLPPVKRSAKTFEENVVAEELRQKVKRRSELAEESNAIYEEIH